jgi:hypothetical protein
MKKQRTTLAVAAFLVLLGALLIIRLTSAMTQAQGGGYGLLWWTVDGGGGASSASRYAVNGTIGQPEAGTMRGGTYVLSGGFWGGTGPAGGTDPHLIYLPIVQRR